ncbi:Fic family protein [Microbacteriaceae bacterium VKM Ac-2855]|nr:Fic family protein [Microbacteriaceae bacterium VKM Ac-2855]
MANYVERLWNPEDPGGLSRKDLAPGRYRAYVPDELGAALPELGPEASGAAEAALVVLARADERIGERGRFLNHLLIRSESISSSWIEGNRITPKKLAIAEILHHGTRVALDVVANVRATEEAITTLADRDRPVTTADIEALQHVIEPALEPGLRQAQNWVGGPGWSPLRADFVPPPETEVRRLVDDLAGFVTETSGNPIVRAAIAHAQFETIHPFADGNGRTGRALIHTVLRRADAVRNVLIPISTVFAGNTDGYIRGLSAFRTEPPQLDEWVVGFARATELAAANAVRLADDVVRLDEVLVQQLIAFRRDAGLSPASPRRDALVLRVLDSLAAEPVVSVETVARRLDTSVTAASRALTQLADAGILGRTKDQKGRLIAWTADRHLGLVALPERSNRVGGADTAIRTPKSGPAAPNPEHLGPLRPRGGGPSLESASP